MEPDEKACPFCAETIKAAAKVCKHCGKDMPIIIEQQQAPTPSPKKKRSIIKWGLLIIVALSLIAALFESPENKARREAEKERERVAAAERTDERRKQDEVRAAERALQKEKEESDKAEQANQQAAFDRKINEHVSDKAKEIAGNRFILEVDSGKPGSYLYSVFYNQEQSSIERIRTDCTDVVRECLQTLMSNGKDPAKDWTQIYVGAYHRFRGETGQAMVRIYGKAHYNFGKDRIDFEAD